MGTVRRLLNFLSHANKQDSVHLDQNGVVKAPSSGFKMPLHYPKCTKDDYEKMEDWKLDLLLSDYGLLALHVNTLREKRAMAIETFIWPHHS